MLRIIGKIPRKVTIACSGGIDSMVVAHFLLKGKREVQLAYFNHDTVHSRTAQKFVEQYADENKLNLIIGKVAGTKNRQSMEEFWREERYKFLDSVETEYLITCHHLDDCMETWLMSSMHGKSKLIPYKRGENIYRPFLMTTKSAIRSYAQSKGIRWIDDPSNAKTYFMRNHVRHNIVPQALKVNPGLRTTIRKKLIEIYQDV